MSAQNRFSDAVRFEAVKLLAKRGVAVAQAARDLRKTAKIRTNRGVRVIYYFTGIWLRGQD